MTITLIGIVFIALGLVALFFPQRIYLIVLSASAGLPSTVGIVTPSGGIPIFYVLSLVGLYLVAINLFRRLRVSHPALKYLLGFLISSFVVTVVSPFLFPYVEVLNPRMGIEAGLIEPASLSFTVSTLAQLSYLVLGSCVVYLVSVQRSLSYLTLFPAVAVGTLFSFISLFPGMQDFVYSLFHNSPTTQYLTNQGRPVGVFAEASLFSSFATVACVYLCMSLIAQEGWLQKTTLVLLFMSAINLISSGAGTGGLTIGVLLVVLVGTALINTVRKSTKSGLGFGNTLRSEIPNGIKQRLGTGAKRIIITVFASLISVIFSIWAILQITGKIGTQSLQARSAADAFSFDLLLKTYGIGVGIGANRASSLITTVLSCTGIIGFLFLCFFFMLMFNRAWRLTSWKSVSLAMITLLISQIISIPDLSNPLLWFMSALLIFAGREFPQFHQAQSSASQI